MRFENGIYFLREMQDDVCIELRIIVNVEKGSFPID